MVFILGLCATVSVFLFFCGKESQWILATSGLIALGFIVPLAMLLIGSL